MLDQLLNDVAVNRPWLGQLLTVVNALLIVIVGVLVSKLLARFLPARQLNPQRQLAIRRIVKYTVVAVAVTWALQVAGVSPGVLLGTAGILTVAIGFASQTSASNLISGIFLMAERPFVVGDVIKIGETTGSVVSIDLLSVRLRTFDNLLVRIPNESVLKSHVTNLTHYPVRRLDMRIGVAYKEDLARVRTIIERVAADNPICLAEPKPLIILLGYGDSSVDLQLSVWSTQDNFLELRNTMYESVKRAFDAAGIEIPFPHRTLYAGTATRPLPVSLIDPRTESR